MEYDAIGTATINQQVTTIRYYHNGFYVILMNNDILHYSQTRDSLVEQLTDDGIIYHLIES